MKTVNIYEANEDVLIKVKIAGIEIQKGEVLYRVKDPTTMVGYEGLFRADQLVPAAEVNI